MQRWQPLTWVFLATTATTALAASCGGGGPAQPGDDQTTDATGSTTDAPGSIADAIGDPSLPLRVAGTTLIGSDGNAMAVRALDLQSYSGRFRYDLQRPSTTVLQQAADLGFNVVILPFEETWFLTSGEPQSGPHPLDDAAFDEVFGPWQKAARDAGVSLVLSLHNFDTFNLWFPAEVGAVRADHGSRALFVRIWTYISTHLDGDDTVAGYVLMHAPNPTSAHDDGGCPACTASKDPKIWYEVAGQAVAALRARGDARPVLIEPSITFSESYDPALFAMLADNAVVFAPSFPGPMAVVAGSNYPGWVYSQGALNCFGVEVLAAQLGAHIEAAHNDGRPVWLQGLGMADEVAAQEATGAMEGGSYYGYTADAVATVEAALAALTVLNKDSGEGFPDFGPFRFARQNNGDLELNAAPIRQEPAATLLGQALAGTGPTSRDTTSCANLAYITLDAKPYGAQLVSGECVVVYEETPAGEGALPYRILTTFDALGRQVDERFDPNMDGSFSEVHVRTYEADLLVSDKTDYGDDGVFESQTTYVYDALKRLIGQAKSLGSGASTSACVGTWNEPGDACDAALCNHVPAPLEPPKDPNLCARCGYVSWVCGESSGCGKYDNANVLHYDAGGALASRTLDWVDAGQCCGGGCACPPTPSWDVECNGEVNHRWTYNFDTAGELTGWSLDNGGDGVAESLTTYTRQGDQLAIVTKSVDANAKVTATKTETFVAGSLHERAVTNADGDLIERLRIHYDAQGRPIGQDSGNDSGSGFKTTLASFLDAETGLVVWMSTHIMDDGSAVANPSVFGVGRYCAP